MKNPKSGWLFLFYSLQNYFLTVKTYQQWLIKAPGLAGVEVKICLDEFGISMVLLFFTLQQTGMSNFDNSLAYASRSVIGHERETEGNTLGGQAAHLFYCIP